MTTGVNGKAMEVFKKVYAINTGEAPDSYPIKSLVDETKLTENERGGQITMNRSKTQAIKEGWYQISRLFTATYRVKVVLVCLIQMSLISG